MLKRRQNWPYKCLLLGKNTSKLKCTKIIEMQRTFARYIQKRTPDMHITSSELTVERFWGQNKMLKICRCRYLNTFYCILQIIKSFYSWNFGWCLNFCHSFMVPNKNKKKHVDNDVLIKFAILSESLKTWYFKQLCLPDQKYYGNICHPEQRYRRTDIWSTLLHCTMEKSMGKYCFDHICYPEQNWE